MSNTTALITAIIGFLMMATSVVLNSKAINEVSEKSVVAKSESELPHGIGMTYLPDGTRCVTRYSQGIDCDWEGSRHANSKTKAP